MALDLLLAWQNDYINDLLSAKLSRRPLQIQSSLFTP